MNISISKRAQNTPASAIRKLVPLADAAKKRGMKVYHVNIGQPDLPTPPEVISVIHKFKSPILEYAPSSGMTEAVLAWQAFFKSKGQQFDIKDILVTSGGSEALLFAFMTVADPGEELLVLEPFYTSYAIIAGIGNVVLKPVRTYASDGFHLPSQKDIEKAITKKTKGIIICNPNNPTGTLYTPKEVELIVKIAKKHELFIISDETYQELVYDGKKVLPFFTFKEIRNQLIIADSVSKRFNSCGARVGCIVSQNMEVMSAILRLAQGRLSVATVEQLAFTTLLSNHKTYVEKIKKIYEGRRNAVMKGLSKIKGVTFVPPQGAFYIIPTLPVDDSDKFAEYLLNEFSDKGETLMVAPAPGFYATKGLGKKEIRIAYVLEEKKLKRAMELLGLAIEKYNKK